MKQFTLAAFSAERRIAALGLFRSTQLDDTRLRHLPLDASKAVGSVRELALRTFESFRPEFVAISSPSGKAGPRVRAFCDAVKEIATELGIPTTEVDDTALMGAYGHPPLTRKEQARRAGRVIWPGLNDIHSQRAAVDAALTGLYIQTGRLFSLHEGER
ncbi:MAG: hypothetical protein V4587_12020 [Acidobacteriota bacterium]